MGKLFNNIYYRSNLRCTKIMCTTCYLQIYMFFSCDFMNKQNILLLIKCHLQVLLYDYALLHYYCIFPLLPNMTLTHGEIHIATSLHVIMFETMTSNQEINIKQNLLQKRNSGKDLYLPCLQLRPFQGRVF